MPQHIEILLAVYNAQAYLRAQVDSILAQDVPLRLLMRDDCSPDGSLAMCQQLAREHPDRVAVVEGPPRNLGVVGNFSELLAHATAPYVMFSDCDDIWLPGKVATTLAAMKALETAADPKQPIPLLVHTDLRVVDDSLRPVADSFWAYQRLDGMGGGRLARLLPMNCVTGSTVMMNRTLVDLARPLPTGCIMHDWWAALIAAALGRIAAVPTPTVLYRQHARNFLGGRAYGPAYIVRRTAALYGPGGLRQTLRRTQGQAQALLERCGPRMPEPTRAMVAAWADMPRRGLLARRAALLKHGYAMPDLPRQVGMWLSL